MSEVYNFLNISSSCWGRKSSGEEVKGKRGGKRQGKVEGMRGGRGREGKREGEAFLSSLTFPLSFISFSFYYPTLPYPPPLPLPFPLPFPFLFSFPFPSSPLDFLPKKFYLFIYIHLNVSGVEWVCDLRCELLFAMLSHTR